MSLTVHGDETCPVNTGGVGDGAQLRRRGATESEWAASVSHLPWAGLVGEASDGARVTRVSFLSL